MRNICFLVLIFTFSSLFGQNNQDKKATDSAEKSTLSETTLRTLYDNGKTAEAWKFMNDYLASHVNFFDAKATSLAAEWYVRESKDKEAINLYTKMLANSPQDKADVLMKRAQSYINISNEIYACADLDEASLLSQNELLEKLSGKMKCEAIEKLTLQKGQKLYYTLNDYPADKKENVQNNSELVVTLEEYDGKGNISYQWLMENKDEKGANILTSEQLVSGLSNAYYFTIGTPPLAEGLMSMGNGMEATNKKLAFWVGKGTLQAAQTGKMVINIGNEEVYFAKMGTQKLVLKYGKTEVLVNCVYAKSDNETEIWILDDESNPLIIKMNINGTSAVLNKIN